jgi:hypothetical protein
VPVTTSSSIDHETAGAIAHEAYIYLYPIILMDVTRAQMTNVARPGEVTGRGPVNAFVHVREFPPGDFRDVVRPNFDTLYSVAWLDLEAEPLIVSVPAAGDNYYLLPMYDMWGEVFACPGTRTTGSDAGAFALVPPGWSGRLPDGVRRIDSPHTVVWVIGRTEASRDTYELVNEFQDGLAITPLSFWGGTGPTITGRHDPSIDDTTPPLRQVFDLSPADFYSRAAELLRKYPPHFYDYPILHRMERLGFLAGEPFDLETADATAQRALEHSVQSAQARITQRQKEIGWKRNGWQMLTEAMGNYGTDYLRRACVELAGLGANLPEDAVYPFAFVDGDGEPLTGSSRYVMAFASDELPPQLAFWSLTVYDDEGFQVPNELDRFAIGDRDHLSYGSDGSLRLYIQHERPSNGGESNWLPAPEGSFNLFLRLYYPKPEALDGTWAPPPVRKVA